jgi:hypothetical protein
MSEGTAAPVAPAPVAAPAVSAPAPTPAPVSTPAAPASAPETPAPVAPAADPAAPASEAAPAAPAAAATTRPAKPKREDFGEEEGGRYLTAHSKWEQEDAAWSEANPNGEAAPAAEVKAEDAADPNAKLAEENADLDLSKLPAEDAAVTPQALQELLTGDAALTAALEANPAAKGKLFQMARRNAEMEPIAKLFPTVQSAEFAQKTAGEYVGLRSKFEMAVVQPEKIGDAFDAFVDQFRIMGADGKPVLDASGQPKLAEDFNMLASHMRQLDIEGSLSEIKARLEANTYQNPAMKERDEQLAFAYELIQDAGNFHDRPDYSHLPEAERTALEEREAKVRAAEEALAAKDGTAKTAAQKAELKAAADKGEKDFLAGHSKYLATTLEATVKEMRDAGAHIPQWMLEYKAPGQSMSTFGQNVINRLVQVVKSDPYLDAQSNKLQRAHARNPTPETLRDRLDFFNGIAKDNLRSIVLDELKTGVKKSAPAPSATAPEAPNPSNEPRGGGGAPAPVAMTQESAMKMAREQLAKELPHWDAMDAAQRNSYALTRMSQIMSAGR